MIFSKNLTLLLAFLACTGIARAAQVEVNFFEEQLQLRYEQAMLLSLAVAVEEKSLVNYYKSLEKTPYQSFLEDLKHYREHLALNDMLYYKLMCKAVDAIAVKQSAVQKDLLCWFLLSRSGYDARLAYLGKRVFVYAYSNDEVFEVPIITIEKRNFVNISSFRDPAYKVGQALFMLNFTPNPQGRSFAFYLRKLPALTPNLITRHLAFDFEGDHYELEAEVDQTLVNVFKDYPLIQEFQYLETPLSPFLSNSLLEPMQKWIANLPPEEALKLLVTFTRSAFVYKADKATFGKNKPMVADEVFYYEYSDCEDRVAILYNLVKTLLGLPMIVVAYPDHLTLGVALPDPYGAMIVYKNKKYMICDPTGPANTSAIGEIPSGYEHAKFEIIGSFKS